MLFDALYSRAANFMNNARKSECLRLHKAKAGGLVALVVVSQLLESGCESSPPREEVSRGDSKRLFP